MVSNSGDFSITDNLKLIDVLIVCFISLFLFHQRDYGQASKYFKLQDCEATSFSLVAVSIHSIWYVDFW